MLQSSTPYRVGQPIPEIVLPSTIRLETLDEPFRSSAHVGKWLVLLFYPRDFTFVCPTELIAFSERVAEFRSLDAEIVGISTDSEFCHRAWIRTPREKGGVGELAFPLAADVRMDVSRAFGTLVEEDGATLRGTFILDPERLLRVALIHDNAIGRSVDEVLRMLQALQTGELCPVDWRPGAPTLKVGP
jgi:peroxiredoxin (alkyl hydroperoxide reductase subunit C)